MRIRNWRMAATLLILLAGCARAPSPPCPPCPPPAPLADLLLPADVERLQPEAAKPEPAAPAGALVKVAWEEVDGWLEDDPAQVLAAFRESCRILGSRPAWGEVCTASAGLEIQPSGEVRNFFEQRFAPYRVDKADGTATGLLTGYYVPDLPGSRQAAPEFPHPLYRRPDDLLTIDLRELYPALGSYRLRGRLDGQKVRPYWDRAAIDGAGRPLAGQELCWVADPVELFFMQIQGSGRISFADGTRTLVGYAEQNGHPYRSIANWLLARGIMTRDQMSMQNLKAWARANPDLVGELLASNPSYVFFRELGDLPAPLGALGVPLSAGRSIAVDPRYVPLGAPVFVASTWPGSERPLRRLVMAQDTGGAIKGEVRADFFWGIGDEAGAYAGRTKQPLRMWVLQPREEEQTTIKSPAGP